MQLYTDFVYWLTVQPTNYLLILAIIGLLLFTVGLILGYLLQRGKTNKALRKLALAEREKAEMQQKLAAGDAEQNTLARQLVKITTEKDDTLVQLREVSGNLGKISADLRKLQATNEQLSATNQTYATTIEDLNDQVIGLKTRNEQLLKGIDGETFAPGAGATNPSPNALEALERRLRILEDRLADKPDTGGDPPVDLGKPRHRVRIGTAEVPFEGQRDDLMRIHAIGPFNQSQLNNAGVYTYRQIANWTDEDLADYAARIGYVADIMREEDWIGQARNLADSIASGAAIVEPRAPDPTDLTVIDGIDPKVAGILKEAGVKDLTTLAETPVDELRAMLEQAGEANAVHRSADWPEQAALIVADLTERSV
ncbi:hypothetical protein CLV84_0078 [Neolewinella xylanilytica]|uniref:Uncharacterized protein n=1 Tax=Neolewinella xylanilytica TaxID=1514080 RepID=A0A2S6I6N1_9BACT|nr:helix-hairpin-helix domain-containing protein [Neolewinella xylanilytica]PPK87144.1 hypothetical protein CLV84_0078 [Neolewinella xylanilytica]